MRKPSIILSLLLLLGLALSAGAQNSRPQFRPSVLGTGPEALINQIDAQELLKAGQKDGAVMFCAAVAPTGKPLASWIYRPMPQTEALQAEITKRLATTKFTAPIYQYQPVGVLLYGTVVFSAKNKPNVRIFLNQDPNEIRDASDFIAPQPVIGGDSKFDGLTPPETETPVPLTAVVDLNLKVSRLGELRGITVLKEEPPLLGFGPAAEADFREAKFIPAFRLGDPVDCEIVQPICYKPVD